MLVNAKHRDGAVVLLIVLFFKKKLRFSFSSSL